MIRTNGVLPAAASAFPTLKNADDLQIELIYENTRRVCYDETAHRLTDEQFLLQIADKDGRTEIRAVCSGEKSAFYALCEVQRRLEQATLAPGEWTVAPRFPVRGYIEGFYGRPWTHDRRLSVLSLMAEHRMNTVFYAPKDDPYHRKAWREPYPAAQLSRLKTLADTAAGYYMTFYWCVAPGLSVCYADPAEFDRLLQKTKQLYGVGVRAFGLLLDDIGETLQFPADRERYGETVNAHADFICRYAAALAALDPAVRLAVCPTLYNGQGNEYYISKLGRNIPPGVGLFWTGRDICSRELTCREAILFFEGTRHKPLYWDNYPVNDMAMRHEMHLGPLIGREPELWKYADGLIANCMEYPECSKIPLITAADYLWLGEAYDPEASWRGAAERVVGKADADAFLTFADHLRVSCLQDENSQRLKALFRQIERAKAAGNKKEARALAAAYLEKTRRAMDFLRRDLPICRELSKWTEKFGAFRDILPQLFDCMIEDDHTLLPQILRKIDLYNALPARFAADMDLIEAAEGGYAI